MRLSLFPKPSLLGLHIHPHALHLVHSQSINGQYSTSYTHTLPMPDQVLVDGKIKQWDVLSAMLAEIVSRFTLKRVSTAICVPVHLVRMQQMEVSAGLSAREIEAEIQLQLRRDLPGLNESLAIDYQVIRQEATSLTVFFSAIREEYLMQYRECVNQSGLRVKIVDVDIYALHRILAMVAPTASAYLLVLNHICTFIISHAIHPVFHQSWNKLVDQDIVTQLKRRMQLYRAAGFQQSVPSLAIFSDTNDLGISDGIVDVFSSVSYPDIPASLNITPEYFTAAGLAMREVPAW